MHCAAAMGARSALRTFSVRTTTASRLATGARPKPMGSLFGTPKQNTLSHRIFRSPVEMSFCVETLLPYHSATASALLTSMLSDARRHYGWTAEDLVLYLFLATFLKELCRHNHTPSKPDVLVNYIFGS